MEKPCVLVVDDNPDNRRILEITLERAGYIPRCVASGAEALQAHSEDQMAIGLLDLSMPVMDGLALLRLLRERDPSFQAIVVTAHGSIERAVEAMKAGATDFLTKPVRSEVLLAQLEKAVHLTSLVQENRRLRAAVGGRYDFSNIISRSRAMAEVIHLAREAAQREVTVLITGESGVGKEVLARAIHYNSERSAKPFFGINAAAIPEALMESELFGYERGAFSGAQQAKEGLLHQANGGTLLLDEIGDVPISVQAKLLRVIETREVIPLGGTKPTSFTARLIAATNVDLRQRARDRLFREDLFFRLSVFPIHVPPLRERREDILPLAQGILANLAQQVGKDVPGFSNEATDYLHSAPWEGNVRELANAIERAVIVSRGQLIAANDFPQYLGSVERPTAPPAVAVGTDLDLTEAERSMLLKALQRAGNNLSEAARILGIGRGALRYRLDKYGIAHK